MALTKADPKAEIVDGLIRGRSFTRIAAEMRTSPEEVHRIWRDYLNENYSPITEIEMRYLSLARLERLLDLLWDQVQGGDFATEGKQTSNVIKIIEQINSLMALNKDPLVEAQVELTKAQTQMVHGMLVEMRMTLLTQVTQALVGMRMPDELREQLRTEVESRWGTWYHDASKQALQVTRGGQD